MFIPALSFLRLLGGTLGPAMWHAFGGAVMWFLLALRHAPDDAPPSPDGGADRDGQPPTP